MSATLFALALFACSDDGSACERLQAPVATYPTKAECSARLDDALSTEAALKADAPTVYAQCLNPQQMASLSTGTVDLNKIDRPRLASRD